MAPAGRTRSGREDSNLRPLDPQSSALTKLRHGPGLERRTYQTSVCPDSAEPDHPAWPPRRGFTFLKRAPSSEALASLAGAWGPARRREGRGHDYEDPTAHVRGHHGFLRAVGRRCGHHLVIRSGRADGGSAEPRSRRPLLRLRRDAAEPDRCQERLPAQLRRTPDRSLVEREHQPRPRQRQHRGEVERVEQQRDPLWPGRHRGDADAEARAARSTASSSRASDSISR